jgi:hypothetical protein
MASSDYLPPICTGILAEHEKPRRSPALQADHKTPESLEDAVPTPSPQAALGYLEAAGSFAITPNCRSRPSRSYSTQLSTIFPLTSRSMNIPVT